jgi:hypothetical protein
MAFAPTARSRAVNWGPSSGRLARREPVGSSPAWGWATAAATSSQTETIS